MSYYCILLADSTPQNPHIADVHHNGCWYFCSYQHHPLPAPPAPKSHPTSTAPRLLNSPVASSWSLSFAPPHTPSTPPRPPQTVRSSTHTVASTPQLVQNFLRHAFFFRPRHALGRKIPGWDRRLNYWKGVLIQIKNVWVYSTNKSKSNQYKSELFACHILLRQFMMMYEKSSSITFHRDVVPQPFVARPFHLPRNRTSLISAPHLQLCKFRHLSTL